MELTYQNILAANIIFIPFCATSLKINSSGMFVLCKVTE